MSLVPRRYGVVLLAAGLCSLLLAGCGGILSAPPERQLYRAAPTFAFAPGLKRVAAQLLVATPSASAGLEGRRIALTRSPVSLDYFADAEWTDRVPLLVQAALVEGFEKSAAVTAVGPESLGLRADFILETAIRDFQAVYGSAEAPPRAVIRLSLKLIRMPERKIVAQTSLSSEAAAAGNAIPDTIRAFDAALGDAVSRAVTWTVTNPLLSEKRR